MNEDLNKQIAEINRKIQSLDEYNALFKLHTHNGTDSDTITAELLAGGFVFTVLTAGFTIAGGNPTSKTLTVALDADVSGTNTGDETQATIKTKLGAATTSVDGYLTSTDWNTFNNKQAALGYTPVPNTRTVNGKALSSDITLALASADFVNQGTTTTVLHGNAAGNPAFGAVVEGDFSFTDITTANVSSTAHGLCPKFPNNTTTFLRGDGTFAAVTTSIAVLTKTFTAGENLLAQDCVYLKSDNKVYKTDPAYTTVLQYIGFVSTNVSSGASAEVYITGYVSGFTGLTPGSTYYASNRECPVFDAVSSASSSGTTALTWAHTCTGTYLTLIVGMTCEADYITGVTYNGVALTKQVSKVASDTTRYSSIWTLANPAVGTYNIIASSANNRKMVGGAVSYTATDVTSIGASASMTQNSGTSATVSVTSTRLNSVVIGVMAAQSDTATTTSAPATERWNIVAVGGLYSFGASQPTTTIGSYSIVWDDTIHNMNIASACILEIKGNQQGIIGLTAGANSQKVGKALSATEIMVIPG